MRKRIIAILATAIILVPALTQSVFAPTPAHVMPNNTLASFDFALTDEKIKDLIEPLVMEMREKENDELLNIASDILLSGRRFSVGFVSPQEVVATVPVVDSEWSAIVEYLTGEGFESSTHGAVSIYSIGGQESLARLGELAVFGSTLATTQKTIDLYEGTATDSLGNLTAYQEVSASYLDPRLAGLTINIEAIGELVEPALADAPEAGFVMPLLDLFKFEGVSVAKVNDGYRFTLDMLGNAEKLAESEISLNPGGTFTPNLFSKFPNAKPLLYFESFNPKAGNEHSQKFMDIFMAGLGEDMGGDLDIYEQIKEETGIDINGMYELFEEEFAFGLQYDQNSPLPYFTALGEISDKNKASARRLADDLAELLTDALKEGGVSNRAYDVKKSDEFTTVTMDITKFDENYDGPPFAEQVVTFGVTEDGLFIVSNYPGIEKASKRTGFSSDPNFSAHITDQMINTGIFYVNMRNLWGWGDAMLAWGERVSGGGAHGPTLEFYRDYYSAIEALYAWKDVFVFFNGTDSRSTVTGKVTVDTAKHKSYKQLIDDLKSSDLDGDGVSDYDERYVYFTSTESGDSDNDGVDDIEELRRGTNPKGDGRLFNDVEENAYYTDEVGLLYQRGAISGYKDGSFQPGKLVNRAEFTTMVVGAFERGTSNFLGVNVELSTKPAPFIDLNPTSWYYTPISKAYAAGFISGSRDEHGNLVFRPGDPITRAEAIAVLNKASTALTKSRPATCTESPFGDVKQDDWFCSAVANGYANGVTSGRSAGKFDPHGLLNRAEAAVMIRRTLEKDLEIYEAGTESFGELTAPIGKSISPAARLISPF